MSSHGFLATLLASTAAAALLLPVAALAQTATPLPPVAVEPAPGLTAPLGGSTVSGEEVAAKRLGTSDTAALLRDALGVDLYSAGGVSSLPAIHGMASDRVKTLVNGRPITSACPNHMNSPLSYIDPSNVAKIDVTTGMTAVSNGGDSIAGTISVESAPPAFAAPGEGVHTEGSLSTSFRSVNRAITTAATASAGVETFSLGYAGDWTKAGNYKAGGAGPKIKSSLYETSNNALTAAARTDDQLFVVEGGVQYVPYEGFPNQRMDMVDNFAKYVNGRYEGRFDWGRLDGKVFWQNTHHEMNFLPDKGGTRGGGMPMTTHGTDLGYALKAELPLNPRDTLRLGNELHLFSLDDWWPPISTAANGMMSPNKFVNINNGERDRIGTFAEWEARWTPQWTTLLGVRNDTVLMDTGAVQGYSNNAMANYQRDAAAFNARNHAKTDVNLDATALVRYEPAETQTYEAGYTRKSRSPNLYERYSWSTGAMASAMIGWNGDANGYIGNVNLKPEVAHTASISAGWHDAARKDWEVKLAPYYTYVQDYIGVNRVTPNPFPAPFVLLQFANHEAQFYGVDVSGKVALWDDTAYGRGELSGKLGWIHGETIGAGASNGIYHLMPVNATLALGHKLGGWSSAAELQLVGGKDSVDNLRNEPVTPGYALVNLKTGYEWKNLRVDFGIENLFNTRYYLPLGGVDYGDYKADVKTGPIATLLGPGRSFNVGLTAKF